MIKRLAALRSAVQFPLPADAFLRRVANATAILVIAGLAFMPGHHTGAGAADRSSDASVRGVVRAVRQATLSTELPLLAVDVPFREGDRFRRGDVLVAFDCRRLNADYAAAAAQNREAELNLDSNRQLDRHNAVGRNEVEISLARFERTKSDLSGLKARLDECRFVAPFDGRVVELGVRKHERTVPQRPYMTIIDDQQLEIESIVASSALEVLQIGAAFTFRVDELGGRSIDAKVSSIAAAVDPVSKTVKVIGAITGPATGILAGMSGTAQFQSGH